MAPRARAARAAASEAVGTMPAAGNPAAAGAAETAGHGAPRPRLTREKVLRTALEFVDANGLAALSMHKLGAELGVQGMSLYSHVENKDALLDGLVEAMTGETLPPPPDGTGWRDALRQLAGEIRALVLRHPAAAPLLVSRQVMTTRQLRQLDGYRGLLMRQGFTEDRAIEVLRTLYGYALGFALVEANLVAGGQCGPWPDDELSRMRRVTEMVPRDAPDPLLRLAMLFCGQCDMGEQFSLGVELMIRGLDGGDGESGR
jgi:AcrR family transcriptional regulator